VTGRAQHFALTKKNFVLASWLTIAIVDQEQLHGTSELGQTLARFEDRA
jgi:hypothetical protein